MLDRVVSDTESSYDNATTNKMLRKRFWAGLKPSLKEASRHKYDTVDDYDRLTVIVRGIEHEHSLSQSKSKICLSNTVAGNDNDPKSNELKELKGIVHQLTNKVSDLTKLVEQQTRNTGNYGKTGKLAGTCWHCGDKSHRKSECPKLPECYRCHKRGHLKRNCRLNYQ